jgi:hypothetical protein
MAILSLGTDGELDYTITYFQPSNLDYRDCDLRFGDRRVDESDDFYKFKAQGRNSWLFESLCTPEDAQDMVGAGGWSAKLWGNAKCECRP